MAVKEGYQSWGIMAYTSEEKLHYYNTPGTDAEEQIERLRARK